ncbi:hypothetical protein EPA93_22805 [Ktedonosporobacter rubrisoli]|uniref:Uncharacterized protein n=1 Tax=Ktedonosporobacter rubrisoli TaxID=2509675 RepID=A0A4P6JTQ6_KTERU|nr:hypothetical protein [Ktedonosporobacter rubrisoli]QBD78662.1 hypothetical protein EPA93_22805 [Ktedonosporobacter rubrisoli]
MIYAIALEDSMRHKIGYAKPMGLGSVALTPTRLKLVDYAERYTQSAGARGINVLEGDELWDFLDERIDEFKQRWLLELALQDLRRIWRWPPDPNVDYYYPDKDDWFDTPDSIGKRIADTRHVP